MKKWKAFLLSFVALIIGAGSYIFYILEIKEYDTADKQVEEITEAEFDITLPVETEDPTSEDSNDELKTPQTETADSDTETVESTKPVVSKNNTIAQKTEKPKSEQDSAPVEKKQVKKVTPEEITTKYEPVFRDLESQANSKIDKLISLAAVEYETKKKNNESVSYPYFYAKYTSAAKTLESNTDAAFNIIYNALINELKTNELSLIHAEKIKDHYETTKKERRSSLLKKAAAYAR